MAKHPIKTTIKKYGMTFPIFLSDFSPRHLKSLRNSTSVQLPASYPKYLTTKTINYSEIEESILSEIHNKFSSTGAQK